MRRTVDTQSKRQVKEPVVPAEQDRHDPEELARWQRLVLPVMVFAVIGAGIFFAVHNDGNVAAFSWIEVKEALGL